VPRISGTFVAKDDAEKPKLYSIRRATTGFLVEWDNETTFMRLFKIDEYPGYVVQSQFLLARNDRPNLVYAYFFLDVTDATLTFRTIDLKSLPDDFKALVTVDQKMTDSATPKRASDTLKVIRAAAKLKLGRPFVLRKTS
jgi:hypothetical protein